MEYKNMLAYWAEKIEKELDASIASSGLAQQRVADAMRYSLLGGGKRLRGALVLEFCRVCGGNTDAAMPFACAVEMIHAYSLIHDDLPCMDDDDMRRGRPSCHIAYGEAMAVLAGDGLLTLAFEKMLSPDTLAALSPVNAFKAAGELARGAGLYGMLGGQCIDVGLDGMLPDADSLRDMCAMKTGALMIAACRMGCIAADCTDRQLAAATEYAKALGLAFQIRDDMLDLIGDSAVLGKATGADEKQHKTTFAGLYGLEKCSSMVTELTDKAVAALSCFEDAQGLCALSLEMAKRMN